MQMIIIVLVSSGLVRGVQDLLTVMAFVTTAPVVYVSGDEVSVVSDLAFENVVDVILAIFGLWKAAHGCR